MPEELYEVTLCNVPFGQAQALYRFFVNLNDEDHMAGNRGMTWSGLVPGERATVDDGGKTVYRGERTVTISPMPTHEQATRERDVKEMVARLAKLVFYEDGFDGITLEDVVSRLADRVGLEPAKL